jgi:hypothetical protein
VLIDEFEQCSSREKIIEMLRTAGRGGTIGKGSPSQRTIEFDVMHMAWGASIDVGLPRAADRNRWIILELAKLENLITAPDIVGLEDLGLDLFTSILFVAPRARELEIKLREVVVTGLESRIRENYTVPAAAFGALVGLTYEQTAKLLRHWLKLFGEGPVDRETDEQALLAAIVSSRVTMQQVGSNGQSEREELTVGQALQRMNLGHDLERFGLRYNRREGRLFIVGKVVTRELLKGTPWAALDINSVLGRMPNALKERQRVGGHPHRGVWVPWCDLEPVPPLPSGGLPPSPTGAQQQPPGSQAAPTSPPPTVPAPEVVERGGTGSGTP